MKVFNLILVLFVALVGSASMADAVKRTPSSSAQACEKAVTKELETKFHGYFFIGSKRQRSVENVDCEEKVSRKQVKYNSCEVSASTGNGGGDVSFVVLLNDKCTRAFSSFIVGEE